MHFGVIATVHAGARTAAESAQVQAHDDNNKVAVAAVEEGGSLQHKVLRRSAVATWWMRIRAIPHELPFPLAGTR
jgi:hypothetical protein